LEQTKGHFQNRPAWSGSQRASADYRANADQYFQHTKAYGR
jgi:hypothetical protein